MYVRVSMYDWNRNTDEINLQYPFRLFIFLLWSWRIVNMGLNGCIASACLCVMLPLYLHNTYLSN
ncbi:hypothetical protein BDV36DRAFT_24133 [Aspergillus pseudocaelatus]|uniref:Uncharacterized protein n=1 Tax=Aspergillus pseudocaelatus TaxID=1825620 RepID=A0ABQ6W9G7_9EURO|nr:hypothetical protein BDV36DRAFT_24133 [Aspergillus pseudocaelatus]